jgi:hypothetical protein
MEFQNNAFITGDGSTTDVIISQGSWSGGVEVDAPSDGTAGIVGVFETIIGNNPNNDPSQAGTPVVVSTWGGTPAGALVLTSNASALALINSGSLTDGMGGAVTINNVSLGSSGGYTTGDLYIQSYGSTVTMTSTSTALAVDFSVTATTGATLQGNVQSNYGSTRGVISVSTGGELEVGNQMLANGSIGLTQTGSGTLSLDASTVVKSFNVGSLSRDITLTGASGVTLGTSSSIQANGGNASLLAGSGGSTCIASSPGCTPASVSITMGSNLSDITFSTSGISVPSGTATIDENNSKTITVNAGASGAIVLLNGSTITAQ